MGTAWAQVITQIFEMQGLGTSILKKEGRLKSRPVAKSTQRMTA
jgi:hypothetical protein